MEIDVIFFVVSFFQFLVVICVQIDSETILSDEFISEINNAQNLWTAGRSFHKNSELRNLISVQFKRQYSLDQNETVYNGSLPVKFDSRTNWPNCTSIGEVKVQGNCASSHAMVASSLFSDRLCIQKAVVRTSSADQILTCCKKCGGGCFGGHIEYTFEYMNKIGLVSGGGYDSQVGCRPYKIQNCPKVQGILPLCPRIRERTPSCYLWKCKNRYFKNFTYDSDKIKLKYIYAVPSKVNAIKTEIITNGPVSSTFTMYEDFFNYKRGVYYHTFGAKVGEFDVKIIGWGKTKQAVPYWIAVNSWGETWGDNGTFKIQLGVNECNIESHCLSGSFL